MSKKLDHTEGIQRQPTILVIDDKIDTLILLREILDHQGYAVVTAIDAQEAKDRIETSPPDVILCDVVMPGVSGFELCRELKNNPETSLIPIILITGLSDRDNRVRGIEAGADAFISKPLSPNELFAEIRRLLSSSGTVRERLARIALFTPRDTSKRDAFISHATEDKVEFVRPLAEALQSAGANIWYDEFALRLGDSLRRSIEMGLRDARYGVVVLSRSFFLKEWTQKELDVLNTKEISGGKVILPVWFNFTREDAERFCPFLADRIAARYPQERLPVVAQRILEVIRPDLVKE
jgi:DNA-binding response OmpR family regulator